MKVGNKHDAGKPEISLIPVEAIEGCAKALTFGANKYGKHNFSDGIEHTRLINSLLRHTMAILRNEDNDPESNLDHVDHILANASMLKFMRVNRSDLDDRWKKNES